MHLEHTLSYELGKVRTGIPGGDVLKALDALLKSLQAHSGPEAS
jgi:hypothetical protein